jgi:uncharacterized membrane protein
MKLQPLGHDVIWLVDSTSVLEEPATSSFRLEERLENVGSSKIGATRFRLHSLYLYVVMGLFWLIKGMKNQNGVGN